MIIKSSRKISLIVFSTANIFIMLVCLSFGGEPPQYTDKYRSPNDSLTEDAIYGSDGYVFRDDYMDTDPDWSPDGKQIIFSSNRDGDADIYIMDSDGSNLFNATPDPSPLLTSVLYLIRKSSDGWPSWSPDGNVIAFSSARDNIMMGSVEPNIMSMHADGLQVTNLTNTIEVDGVPDWSPSGEKIVFVSDREPGTNIFVMDSDGSNVVQLTNMKVNNDFPRWSPDGSQIVFDSDRDGNYEIYLMETDGSKITRITNDPAKDEQPCWSPDGDQIAFSSDRDGDFEIYIMDADGSNITRVTENDIDDWDPAWSPDGKKIALRSKTDEGWRIFTVNVDGSNLVQLTGGPIEVPAAENSIYYLNLGISTLYRRIADGDGSFETAIEALNKAIALDETLAEAYLARGMALLNRCGMTWAHVVGTQIRLFEYDGYCEDFDQAIADFETAIELGLAPGVQPGAENLMGKLKD